MKEKIAVLLMGGILIGLAGCTSKKGSTDDINVTSIQENKDENSNKENDLTDKKNGKESEISIDELLSMDATPDSCFLYVDTDEGMAITKYMGDDDTVIIPDEIEGVKVTELYETFRWDGNIKNVVISGNVQLINKETFTLCTNLEKVVIKDSSLKEIGDSAFMECEKLKYINLPQGLEMIDNMAFYGCKELKDIEIPDSVTFIHNSAFLESGVER